MRGQNADGQARRRLGKFLVGMGLFLILVTGGLTALLAPSLLHPGTEQWGPTFSGTSKDGVFSLMLLVLVILFGVNALTAGVLQIRRGRRSKWLLPSSIALVVLMIGAGKNIFREDHSASGGREDDLVKMAEEANRELPQGTMLDRETRVDHVFAVPGQSLVFQLTLVNVASAEFDRAATPAILAKMKKTYCPQAIVKDVLNRGASVVFKWGAKDGPTLLELSLTTEKCRE